MSNPKKLNWHFAAKRSALRSDTGVAIFVGKRHVSLWEIEGKVYAIDNLCTHELACLSDGYLDGDQVECPLHQARFHIPTGRALSPPAPSDLRVYHVDIQGENIFVGTDD